MHQSPSNVIKSATLGTHRTAKKEKKKVTWYKWNEVDKWRCFGLKYEGKQYIYIATECCESLNTLQPAARPPSWFWTSSFVPNHRRLLGIHPDVSVLNRAGLLAQSSPIFPDMPVVIRHHVVGDVLQIVQTRGKNVGLIGFGSSSTVNVQGPHPRFK